MICEREKEREGDLGKVEGEYDTFNLVIVNLRKKIPKDVSVQRKYLERSLPMMMMKSYFIPGYRQMGTD